MSVRVLETELYLLPVKTRLPFRYGMITLRECPHLICRAVLDVDGVRIAGLSADHLPPKWFTKNPDQPFEDEVSQMLEAARSACRLAQDAGAAESVFELWHRVDAEQSRWGATSGYSALLNGFGTSFIERAAIDAVCRAGRTTFSTALRNGPLGLRLDAVHPELAGRELRDLLPMKPRQSIIVRHTIGLLDPLTDSEIAPADRVDDGLPQSLEASVGTYGLTHFKIKLTGDPRSDAERLRHIADLLGPRLPRGAGITLDGNENFSDPQALAELSGLVCADSVLQPLLERCLLFLEQPFPRDIALGSEAAGAARKFSANLPMIIDESGATADDVRVALDSGYAGTSHKNCKGVFKGIANACLLEHRRRSRPEARFILSGEDLSTIGPVSLQQDLAVHATLGIEHVERNGHHYFAGLSMWPAHVQEAALRSHPDLYRRSPRAFPSLRIEKGSIRTSSVIDAPFGVAFDFEPAKIAGAQRCHI